MTTCETVIESHVEYLRSRLACRISDERVWMMSPHTHIDGDVVEVAVREQADGTVAVSDLGETLRRLATFGYDPREGTNGRYLIAQIAKQYRVDVDEAGIIYKVAVESDVGEATHDVISASLAVGNLVFLARAIRPATIQEEVAEYLRNAGVPFAERSRVAGKTGKKYSIDFAVGEGPVALVKTISAATVGGVTSATNAAFRAWYDIDAAMRATIVDDRVWPWRTEDVAILSTVSQVFRWSDQADDFVEGVMLASHQPR